MKWYILLTAMFFNSLLQPAYSQNETRLGGYGELHYNKPVSGLPEAASAGELDFHRFVVYFSHPFEDWIWFYSELELEHTRLEGGEDGGELALEQAYVQLQYSKAFGIRAGIMIVPLGLVNVFHEPPAFHGVERPNVERYIIPSTWREAGIGINGSFAGGWQYEVYLMAGLNPDGLRAGNGIRGARQIAFESSTDDISLAARLDYRLSLNLTLGGALFYSGLEKPASYGDALKGANLKMGEVHLQYQRGNFQAKGLAAYSKIANTERLNAFYGYSDNMQIGDSQFGAYVEGAYDIWGWFQPESTQRLYAFTRYEQYNTQNSTSGFEANKDFERQEITFGLTYLPTSQVCFKLDYQFLNTADNFDRKQFNLGVGYNF